MAPSGSSLKRTSAAPAFDAKAFLESSGLATAGAKYARGESIFSKGDACGDVMYIQSGGVKLSVVSNAGREAVVAMLGPGEFFGEGCLAGQTNRMGSATAITPSVILHIARKKMTRLLRQQRAMSDRFISHMLSRNMRIEEDLIDQLFNSTEERLARILLVLARYGQQHEPSRTVPRLSQDELAELAGTTPARVKFFLSKFKKLGFIESTGDLPITIHRSLLSVVLHD